MVLDRCVLNVTAAVQSPGGCISVACSESFCTFKCILDCMILFITCNYFRFITQILLQGHYLYLYLLQKEEDSKPYAERKWFSWYLIMFELEGAAMTNGLFLKPGKFSSVSENLNSVFSPVLVTKQL